MWMRTPHSDGAIDAPSKHMHGHWGYGGFYNYGVGFYPSCYFVTKPWGVVKVCPDNY